MIFLIDYFYIFTKKRFFVQFSIYNKIIVKKGNGMNFLKKKLRKEFLILLTLCKLLNGIKKDFKFIVKKGF